VNIGDLPSFRKLRISGSLIVTGLLVELLSLLRIHPLAFLAFIFLGGLFLIVGIAFYLYSAIDAPSPRTGPGRHEN
jgi:predicted membrane channel-forming protein YqfA (hemolysin III family)